MNNDDRLLHILLAVGLGVLAIMLAIALVDHHKNSAGWIVKALLASSVETRALGLDLPDTTPICHEGI
jgi:hypothetical protein